MRYLLITLYLISSFTLYAQGPIAFALYDVGRLYDTIPSNFYDDSGYTPKGRNRWNSERYTKKIDNIVAVIDSMQMPIVALAGVENEEVVRDIVERSKEDYSYLHRTLDYYDGLDFALLYYGDQLFVNKIYTTSVNVVVECEINQVKISLRYARVGGKLRSIEPISRDDQPDITIVWGRLSKGDIERLGMDDLLRETEVRGGGDSRGDMGWYVENRIGVKSSDCYNAKSGVYIAPWLLTSDGSAPLATFSSECYFGGYSRHLPAYLYISK